MARVRSGSAFVCVRTFQLRLGRESVGCMCEISSIWAELAFKPECARLVRL
jgi:hypothetical protein